MNLKVPRPPKGLKVVRYGGRERHHDRLLCSRPIVATPCSRNYYVEIAATRAHHHIPAKSGRRPKFLGELIRAYTSGIDSAKATRAAPDHAEPWLQEVWESDK
jgi:hypothetical protein